jgi:hypothetical protein
MYYPRWELQRRYAIIFTNGFMAGAFGGVRIKNAHSNFTHSVLQIHSFWPLRSQNWMGCAPSRGGAGMCLSYLI